MKRILALTLALVMLAALLPGLILPAAAESLYIRKIVSVVYDDSGSMANGNKCNYANYAMQAFCGMLNSEDQLFITYMSEAQKLGYQPEKIDLSASGIQKSVNDIQNREHTGTTPYKAVEVAFEKLKSVSDPNPNTQYWLVVITDGEFNEFSSKSNSEKKNILNQNFLQYAGSVMPNGTNAQVTFLGIGDVTAPDEKADKGIFTYSASDAKGIIGAMSDMADRISGRTRLQSGAIQKLDDKTIQVSSAIPLLNIAVFAQGSNAKLTKAVYSNENPIPITRKAMLADDTISGLVGGAYLLGDAQTVIGAGNYRITFDKAIDLSNVIVLFEPALEMRMQLTLNGKVVDASALQDEVMQGDKIGVSCKIYEMGTDREVSPDLLPPDTKFEITVKENGQVVARSDGKSMSLPEYTLNQTQTEITAAVLIAGFNPIDTTFRFTPAAYVPRVEYTLEASYGSDVQMVKFDEIATNQDLRICFTVLADGVPLTDPEAVKALNPVVSAYPQGNSGSVSYSPDGKIVFTPNAAAMVSGCDGKFQVEVQCALEGGATASLPYTVLVASYEVIGVHATQSVRKTELFGNQVGVSFYITKDGVKLGRAEVEQGLSVLLNQPYENLEVDVMVQPDGTIIITPHSLQQRGRGPLKWLFNWKYYWFDLPGADITVILSHPLGSAQSTINVVGADIGYMILRVWLPLIVFISLVIFVVAYALAHLTRPKFAEHAVLYVGNITKTFRGDAHEITLRPVKLAENNRKLKYILWPFMKMKAQKLEFPIYPDRTRGCIRCDKPTPWICGPIISRSSDLSEVTSPADVVAYKRNHSGEPLCIEEIKRTSVSETMSKVVPADPTVYYFFPTKKDDGSVEIEDAKVFCYIMR